MDCKHYHCDTCGQDYYVRATDASSVYLEHVLPCPTEGCDGQTQYHDVVRRRRQFTTPALDFVQATEGVSCLPRQPTQAFVTQLLEQHKITGFKLHEHGNGESFTRIAELSFDNGYVLVFKDPSELEVQKCR